MDNMTEDKKLEIVGSLFSIKREQISKSKNDEFCLKYENQDIKIPIKGIISKEDDSKIEMFYYTENNKGEQESKYISYYNFLDTTKLLVKYNINKIPSDLNLPNGGRISIGSEIGTVVMPNKKEEEEDFSYKYSSYEAITIDSNDSRYKIILNNSEKSNFKILKSDGNNVSKNDLLEIKKIIELNFLKDTEKEKYKNEDALFIYLTVLEQINEFDNLHIPSIINPSFTSKPYFINIKQPQEVSKISKDLEKKIIEELLLVNKGDDLKDTFFDPLSENDTFKNCILQLKMNITIPSYINIEALYNEEDNPGYNFDGYNKDSIKHAANIVVDGNGKKYLIDSSLVDYLFLFGPDNNSKRKYNVELFDTQKIVPSLDLVKIYSVQEGNCCKLWSVFLNVETNKIVKNNSDKDLVKIINDNFDEIFLNASIQMSELIDKKKAVLFEKPVGLDKDLYKPYQFNDKTIYILTTDDATLKSKCVKTDVLVNMIYKHEVERLLKEEIIRDGEVVEHDKFQQLHNLLDTMEKNDLNSYVKLVKDRILKQTSVDIDSLSISENERKFYKDKIEKLRIEQLKLRNGFERLMESRPKFVSSGKKPDERDISRHREALDSLNDSKRKIESNKQKIVSAKGANNYWQQKILKQQEIEISNIVTLKK